MKKRLLWCCLGLCVLWTAFIFSRSLKSGTESSAESGAALELVGRILDTLGISWRPSEHLLRKLGHFSEYFLLGALSFPSAKLFLSRLSPLLAWGYATAVAFLDEFLMQNLALGRGPSILDVLIDTSGAATAILLLLLLTWRKERLGNFLKKVP